MLENTVHHAKRNQMEKSGVIRKVTVPTKWINAMHIVHNPNSKLHICFDPCNKAILCEYFKLQTCEKVMVRMSGATIFSKRIMAAKTKKVKNCTFFAWRT